MMTSTTGAFLLIAFGLVVGMVLAPTAGISIAGPKFIADLLPQFVATIAGVIAGAGITLWIEAQKAQKAEVQRRVAAVNLAVLTLARMYSEQEQYRKEVIEPARSSPVPWYSMKPARVRFLPPPQFDYVGLQFLSSSSDPNIMGELVLEEGRFASLVAVADLRSELHIGEVQPRLEHRSARGGTITTTIPDLEDAIGPRKTQLLKDYTSTIIDFCDSGVVTAQKAMTALHAAAKSLMPDEKMMQFRPGSGGTDSKLVP
jgi:hypothetical protein